MKISIGFLVCFFVISVNTVDDYDQQFKILTKKLNVAKQGCALLSTEPPIEPPPDIDFSPDLLASKCEEKVLEHLTGNPSGYFIEQILSFCRRDPKPDRKLCKKVYKIHKTRLPKNAVCSVKSIQSKRSRRSNLEPHQTFFCDCEKRVLVLSDEERNQHYEENPHCQMEPIHIEVVFDDSEEIVSPESSLICRPNNPSSHTTTYTLYEPEPVELSDVQGVIALSGKARKCKNNFQEPSVSVFNLKVSSLHSDHSGNSGNSGKFYVYFLRFQSI